MAQNFNTISERANDLSLRAALVSRVAHHIGYRNPIKAAAFLVRLQDEYEGDMMLFVDTVEDLRRSPLPFAPALLNRVEAILNDLLKG